MADTTPPLPGEISNEKRRQVFVTLIETDESLTPSEIADRLDFSRELVYHHLKKLVDLGLVIGEDGEYRSQPVFTDPAFQEKFVAAIADLTPAVAERVVFDEEATAETAEATVFNCVRMAVALNLMPPEIPLTE